MALNKEKVIDSARKFVEKNQLDKAVKEYLRVVEEDPKDVRIWLKIGELYTKKGAKQEATDTYLKVASFYESDGFAAKAIAVYAQVLRLDPDLPEAHVRLAELYCAERKLPLALTHLESAVHAYFAAGKAKEALAIARRIIDLDPENVANRIKLAEMYSREKQTGEAIAQFTEACSQLRALGRTEDFVKVAERLLWHQPDNADVARELADLYLQRRDPRRALQKLQVLFKQDPHQLETLAMLAMAFQGLDQKAKAISVLKELGKLCIERRMPAEADATYRKILRLNPDDAEARAYVQSQPSALPAPTTTSVQTTRDAAKTPPMEEVVDFSVDLRQRESASYRLTSVAGEQHAEEIAKLLEDADVYIRYKLFPKAATHLHKVLELDSDSVEARERLKDLYVAQGQHPQALAELLFLADLVVATDPARASDYAREALNLDPNHRATQDFIRRHRLDALAGAGPVFLEDTAVGEMYRTASRTVSEEELLAHGSPAPSRPPERPDATLVGRAASMPRYRVEDGLSEVDFFVEHQMMKEARESLLRLQRDFPNHPLVQEKADELDAMPIIEALEAPDGLEAYARASSADLVEDLEEIDPEELSEIGEAPSAHVREALADSDVDSNYDLAMAYKEMGQFRDAIVTFGKIAQSPARGVQARLMMGMCHRELGHMTDAVREFKQALHGTMTDLERQSLYYELGVTSEQMHDPSEALYYYDMIIKRYGDYRDTSERISRLRR